MRRLTILTVAVVSAVSIGCGSAANTNVKSNANANANSNVAVVVNNSTSAVNSNAANNSRWNPDISREQYDKEKDRYAKEAETAKDKVGTGLNDGWLWTKTKAALATTNDLRDSTINVDVDKEVVTLRGTVASETEKNAAIKVAKNIEGVKDVKSDALKVQANDSLTNQMVNGNSANSANSARKPQNANAK